MGADAGVEAHALDDGACVEALHLGVGVQLVEVADAQGQVGVGEEFDGLGLRRPHEQDLRVVERGPAQQRGKLSGRFFASLRMTTTSLRMTTISVVAHDDAGGVEVVVEGLALAEELRREEEAPGGVLLLQGAGVAHGDGALDDHHGFRVDAQDQLDDLLHVGGVEEVLLGVVVGRGGDDHEVGVAVGGRTVERGGEPQRPGGEVLLDLLVLDGADPAVDLVDLVRDHVHGHDVVVLREERSKAEAHIAGAGDCDFHIFSRKSGWM